MTVQVITKVYKIITDGLYCGNQCDGLGFINGIQGVKCQYFQDQMNVWMTDGWQIRVLRCTKCRKEFGND